MTTPSGRNDALPVSTQAGDIRRPMTFPLALQTHFEAFPAIERKYSAKPGIFPTAIARGPRRFSADAETENEIARFFTFLKSACGR